MHKVTERRLQNTAQGQMEDGDRVHLTQPQRSPGTNAELVGAAINGTDDDNGVTPWQQRQLRNVNKNTESQNLSELLQDNKTKVILSDSNGCRLRVSDKNVKNVSVSGATLADIQSLIEECHEKDVDSVAVHLGTNDVKSGDATETVIQKAKNALKSFQTKWPHAEIAYSSILPRIGKSKAVRQFNKNAISVNNGILHHCQSNSTFRYIDNGVLFQDEGIINRSLYNTNDPAGIHVNDEGARVLYRNLTAFLIDSMSDENDLELGRSKRLRSDDSVTSQELRAKHGRNYSN